MGSEVGDKAPWVPIYNLFVIDVPHSANHCKEARFLLRLCGPLQQCWGRKGSEAMRISIFTISLRGFCLLIRDCLLLLHVGSASWVHF